MFANKYYVEAGSGVGGFNRGFWVASTFGQCSQTNLTS